MPELALAALPVGAVTVRRVVLRRLSGSCSSLRPTGSTSLSLPSEPYIRVRPSGGEGDRLALLLDRHAHAAEVLRAAVLPAVDPGAEVAAHHQPGAVGRERAVGHPQIDRRDLAEDVGAGGGEPLRALVEGAAAVLLLAGDVDPAGLRVHHQRLGVARPVRVLHGELGRRDGGVAQLLRLGEAVDPDVVPACRRGCRRCRRRRRCRPGRSRSPRRRAACRCRAG